MKAFINIFSKIIQEIDAFIESLIFAFPGMLGGKLRLRWCKTKMGNFGLRSVIGYGVKFIEPKNMKLGNSCFIGIRSFFTADGGEIIIGDDTSFNTNVHINASGGGTINIGNSVLIAPNVVMRTSGHRFDDPNMNIRKQGYTVKNITIEDDVWIGSNSVIVGGVVIGRGAVIGAGAVVTKDIPPMTIAVGIPARVIKNRKNINMDKEKKVCIICESNDIKFVTSYRTTNVIFSNTQIVECVSCGMVFADPMPSEESLINYNASYFMNAPDGLTVSNVASAYYYAIAQLRYEYVCQFLIRNSITVNSVLEIGPGPGYFAENWLLHHPNNKYFAIESDSSCHNSLIKKGVKLIDNTNDHKLEEGIDLVVISHVLEHVSKPDDFLLYITKPLKKGGAIFIEVPCQDWKHKPTDEPHLLFFDKKPMKLLLNKIGFDNVITSYFGQRIEKLLKRTFKVLLFKKLQDKLIAIGIIWPFSKKRPGMETLNDPLQRAAVAQFEAHIESSEPAWWLRALAVKSSEK